MGARSFVDTNVLVYAFDDAAGDKRDRARALLTDPDGPLIISAQVIGEFYVVVTRKLAVPLDETQAGAAVAELLRLPVVPIDGELTREAVSTSQAAQISYWDALIVEAAATAGCDRLLTEDLSAGMTIRSVRVENPFAPAP
jgi:predicted nucleic acid-binding protein